MHGQDARISYAPGLHVLQSGRCTADPAVLFPPLLASNGERSMRYVGNPLLIRIRLSSPMTDLSDFRCWLHRLRCPPVTASGGFVEVRNRLSGAIQCHSVPGNGGWYGGGRMVSFCRRMTNCPDRCRRLPSGVVLSGLAVAADWSAAGVTSWPDPTSVGTVRHSLALRGIGRHDMALAGLARTIRDLLWAFCRGSGAGVGAVVGYADGSTSADLVVAIAFTGWSPSACSGTR